MKSRSAKPVPFEDLEAAIKEAINSTQVVRVNGDEFSIDDLIKKLSDAQPDQSSRIDALVAEVANGAAVKVGLRDGFTCNNNGALTRLEQACCDGAHIIPRWFSLGMSGPELMQGAIQKSIDGAVAHFAKEHNITLSGEGLLSPR